MRNRILLLSLCVFFSFSGPAFAAAPPPHVNKGDVVYDASGGTANAGEFPNGYENHGDVTAIGGNGGSSYGSSSYNGSGIYINNGGFINYGSVTAIGGNGGGDGRGSGIYVNSGGFTNYGSVTATGGIGGSGGSGDGNGSGIYVFSGSFTNYGDVTATGGNGGGGGGNGRGSGIYVHWNGFTNYGSVTAIGGTSGSGNGSGSGIYVYFGGFTNNGSLILGKKDGGNAASVYLRNDYQDMNFVAGSSLLLAGGVIDMGGNTNTLNIDSKASLASLSASGLGVNETLTHTGFIDNAFTGSANSFKILNSVNSAPGTYNTATLKYDLAQTTGSFNATVTRLALPSSLASGTGGAYLAVLEKAIQASLPSGSDALDPAALDFAQLLSLADHQLDAKGVRKAADDLVRTTTPQHTANAAPKMVLQANRVIRGLFSDNLQRSGGFGPGAFRTINAEDVADNGKDGVADEQNTAKLFSMWAQPFYHNGKLDAENNQYSDTDIEFYGGSIGLAYDAGLFVVGASFHFMTGDMDATGWDSDVDAYGLTLGLGRSFELCDSLNLWTQIHGGYTRYSFDQTRKDMIGQHLSSEPDADVFSLGALAAFDIALADTFSITPSLGLDYTRIDMDSYTESGGGTALRVSPDDYDSLLGTVGLAANWQPVAELSMELRGRYYYEFEDTEAKFHSQAVKLASLKYETKGQDTDRHSGSFGGGFAWNPVGTLSLGLDYDYFIADNYTGHEISAMLKVEF